MKCPQCGGRLVGDAPDRSIWFNCEDCGDRFIFEDGELTNVRDRCKKSSRRCIYCDKPLRGGESTLPWENGNNPDGFVKCPHCGRMNMM